MKSRRVIGLPMPTRRNCSEPRPPIPFSAGERGLASGLRGYRNAWDLHIDRAQMIAAGEIKGFPVGAAKGQIGRGGRPVHDAPELLALGVDEPQPAGAAAIDVAFDIDLHAVRDAGLGSAQIDIYAVGLLR